LFFDFGVAADDFVIEQGGLDGPEAADAPAGGDHLVDQVGFGFGGGSPGFLKFLS
jgi:hypothetical protein